MSVWQAIYDELKDDGLEIIAVAFDTGGKDAVASRIRCEDLAERPDALGRRMGWNEDLWGRQSPPQYPCLIDESHRVAELYGMTNVPQAVWIDEEGNIVRPAESAVMEKMSLRAVSRQCRRTIPETRGSSPNRLHRTRWRATLQQHLRVRTHSFARNGGRGFVPIQGAGLQETVRFSKTCDAVAVQIHPI